MLPSAPAASIDAPAVAARLVAFGGPDQIEVQTLPTPEPGPGEARVVIEASSVQFTDTLIRRGRYPDLPTRPPVTLGYDLVGRVDAVGPGVTEVAVGDRVADLVMIGGNARYAIRPAAGLVPVPESVDAAEAVTLVLSWQSAQQAVFRVGQAQPGDRVLVLGGNGAVGQAAIVLAKAAGCEVFATARERHHELLRALGATPLPRDGWLDAVRGQMDVVLDGVAADRFRSPAAALRRGGRLVAIGMSALVGGPMWRLVAAGLALLWLYVVPNGLTIRFYSITARRKTHPEDFREDLETLFEHLATDRLRPAVERRIGLHEVADAHRALERGGLVGKIVVEPSR
ncbi:MAG: zinc-binding dehydrogenase [Myxococcota bacterium]